ncbi:MAG: heavy-metal-associated domain-containing protein [Candidatus Latescibacterota bacterium]|jgi:copper chaperone CopZ
MLFGKKQEKITVKGMSCSHCEQTVEKGLEGTEGVVKVKADSNTDSVVVYYKGNMPNMTVVRQKIVDLGYEPVGE